MNQVDNNLPESVSLAKVFQCLADREGGLQINFKESDNVNVYRVCIATLRFPITKRQQQPLQLQITGQHTNTLSVGRLVIHTSHKNNALFFTGVIRIKSLSKIGSVLTALMTRMDTMVREADNTTDS